MRTSRRWTQTLAADTTCGRKRPSSHLSLFPVPCSTPLSLWRPTFRSSSDKKLAEAMLLGRMRKTMAATTRVCVGTVRLPPWPNRSGENWPLLTNSPSMTKIQRQAVRPPRSPISAIARARSPTQSQCRRRSGVTVFLPPKALESDVAVYKMPILRASSARV